MVILDPDASGCAIYNDMMASYIKGQPEAVCYEILKRVCCGMDNFGRPHQVITVGLVMGTMGCRYRDIFNEMELQYVVEIPKKHLECVLPVIYNSECFEMRPGRMGICYG